MSSAIFTSSSTTSTLMSMGIVPSVGERRHHRAHHVGAGLVAPVVDVGGDAPGSVADLNEHRRAGARRHCFATPPALELREKGIHKNGVTARTPPQAERGVSGWD